jgi:cyclopropane-fatty-acyl-phospholipid synthase
MSGNSSQEMRRFEDVQAHYDLSDDFFGLFQDASRTYSCAYFERDDMSLAEAQLAKLDLSLGKLGLRPGMTLLDVGCGWGSTMMRSHQVLLRDWGEFSEPVDRIVTIEALEHFGFERYDEFFKFAYDVLPDDGVMLLHSVTCLTFPQMTERGIPLSFEAARFVKFMMTEIFPGGRLPSIEKIEEHSTKAGFNVTRIQSLQSSFATTLDLWAEALAAHRDEAIAIQSEEVYDRYMHYLTGCAKGFRIGYVDLNQFTLEK